ncbi:hypothetical protein C8J31_13029 [Rhizobium sp. PP-CC-2G-626]|nr:hypothetical protein C8J31_13029 [Rhizobium sp. PP-CC-2G-626]
MGNGQLMGGCADIEAGVVQDEILEVDEFAINPQGRDRVSEVLPFEKAVADRRAGDALVEAR